MIMRTGGSKIELTNIHKRLELSDLTDTELTNQETQERILVELQAVNRIISEHDVIDIDIKQRRQELEAIIIRIWELNSQIKADVHETQEEVNRTLMNVIWW